MFYSLEDYLPEQEHLYNLTPFLKNLVLKILYYLLVSLMFYFFAKFFIILGVEFWIFLVQKFKLINIFKMNLLEQQILSNIKSYLFWLNKLFFALFYLYTLSQNLFIKILIDVQSKTIYIINNRIFDFQIQKIQNASISSIQIKQSFYKKIFFLYDLYIYTNEIFTIKNIYINKKYLLLK
ncbi:MAG: hypothetical protein ACK4UJ_01530 [Leptonema sp. (in: bacteria)]